jgi:hypothetical protein
MDHVGVHPKGEKIVGKAKMLFDLVTDFLLDTDDESLQDLQRELLDFG